MMNGRVGAGRRGLLTVEKKGKKNIFSGRILEIEGLGHLKCEQVLSSTIYSTSSLVTSGRSRASTTSSASSSLALHYLHFLLPALEICIITRCSSDRGGVGGGRGGR